MKKLLIPIDGSEFSASVIKKGVEIARAFDGEIVLLNIIDYVKFDDESQNVLATSGVLEKQSEKVLQKGKEILASLGFSSFQIFSEFGETGSAISEFAEKNNIDLIIMGSQGLNAGRIKGMFVGSVTRKVLNHTELPVLVVKKE